MFKINKESLIQRLLKPIFYASPFPIIVLDSWMTFWWVVVLAFEYFNVEIPFYQLLLAHAPREFWLVVFLAISLGLFIGRILGSIFIQRASMLITVGVWTFVTALLCRVNPFFYATGYYGILAIISAWAYWRIRYGVYGRLDTSDS